MLETYLPVPNVSWSNDAFTVLDADQLPNTETEKLTQAHGRFATVRRIGDTIVMARDRLGLNKLYFALDHQRGLIAANYLADLVGVGIPFESIYAVPAGTATLVNLRRRTIDVNRYHQLPRSAGETAQPQRQLKVPATGSPTPSD